MARSRLKAVSEQVVFKQVDATKVVEEVHAPDNSGEATEIVVVGSIEDVVKRRIYGFFDARTTIVVNLEAD